MSLKRRRRSTLPRVDTARMCTLVLSPTATMHARETPSISESTGRVAAIVRTVGAGSSLWSSVSRVFSEGEWGVMPAMPSTSRMSSMVRINS